MRSPLPQRLANLCRLALLAASACGLCTLGVFTWRPDLVDRAEAWIRRKHDGADWKYQQEADAARLAGRTDLETQALSTLAERLASVRALDRQRLLARDALKRLVALHEAAGNLDQALVYQRRLLQTEPNSLADTRDLAARLFRSKDTRAEAFALLLGDPKQGTIGLAHRVPNHQHLVPLLVHELADDGRLDEARAALHTALTWPQGAWWWVFWGTSGAREPKRYAGFQPRLRPDGTLFVAFAIGEPLRSLELLPPTLSSCVLEDFAISVRSPGQSAFAPLPIRSRTCKNLEECGDALVLTGDDDPMVEFQLATPLPAGGHEFQITAKRTATEPVWLRRLLLGPHGATLCATADPALAQLAAARQRAFGSVAIECFWGPARGAFAADRRRVVPLGATTPHDGGAAFAVDVPLPAAWAWLRLDLGSGERATWRFARAELQDAEGRRLASVDLAQAELADATRAGQDLVASGPDAQLQFPMPPGGAGAHHLRLEGTVR